MGGRRAPVHALQEDVSAYTVRTDVGRLLLAGLSEERIAEKLDIDATTVAKRKRDIWAAWAGELEDTQGLRGFLFQLALDVYRLMHDGIEAATPRTKPSYAREMRGSIQAMLDVTGLRTLRVDVGSSQLAQLMAGMLAAQTIDAPSVRVIGDGSHNEHSAKVADGQLLDADAPNSCDVEGDG